MFVTLEDIIIGARNGYGEGRGGSYQGLKDICHTVINRTDKRIGDADHTIAAAVLRHRQYSAWNEGDPNREKMQRANVNQPLFRKCVRAMLEALDEPDPTHGARHYMTKARRAKGWPRSWGPVRKPCHESGDHLFYNNVD